MLHTKSLIRRLTYVPWLLTAGLVLGLVGAEEAMAQGITLTIDKYEISEGAGKDGGKVDVTVTAQIDAKATADIRLGLDFRSISGNTAIVVDGEAYTAPAYIDVPPPALVDDTTPGTAGNGDVADQDVTKTGVGTRFRIEGMDNPIVFKKDDAKDTKKTAVLSIYPVENGAIEPDLYIAIVDSYVQPAATVVTHTNTTLRLIDNDGPATRLTLAPDMTSISNESDEITIKVNAYLNGAPLGKDVEFDFTNITFQDLTINSDGTLAGGDDVAFDTFLPGELGEKFDRATTGTANPIPDSDPAQTYEGQLASRDVDYSESSGFGTVKLAKDATSKEISLKIDPNSFDTAAHYPRFIMLGTRD